MNNIEKIQIITNGTTNEYNLSDSTARTNIKNLETFVNDLNTAMDNVENEITNLKQSSGSNGETNSHVNVRLNELSCYKSKLYFELGTSAAANEENGLHWWGFSPTARNLLMLKCDVDTTFVSNLSGFYEPSFSDPDRVDYIDGIIDSFGNEITDLKAGTYLIDVDSSTWKILAYNVKSVLTVNNVKADANGNVNIATMSSFSDNAKIALLNCLENVAYINETGRTLYDVLRKELNVKDYVKSGLVLWFDGIDNTTNGHVDSLSTWEDLSGNGHHMTCVSDTTGTTLKSAQCGDDYVYFDGATIFYNDDSILNLLSLNPGTLEIVFEQENTGDAQMIFTTKTSATDTTARNIALWYRPTSNGYCIFSTITGKSTAAVMDMVMKKTTISVSVQNDNNYKVIANGNEISNFVDGGSIPCNRTFAVGGKTWTEGNLYAFSGKIYAIRYYNRVLTEEEIAQNLKIDKYRFGF